MTAPFGARLVAAMADRGPLCAGIDPHRALLTAWNLDQTPAGLERFALTVIDALADRIAVLKPQSAFFESFGSAGVAVLERVLAAGRDAGALMLLDAKRGDIGSTMAAYAHAYLADDSPLAADALTVSPFLGFGSLRPAIDAALESGRGLFVLCRTSNPEGPAIQDASGLMTAPQATGTAAGPGISVGPDGVRATISAQIAAAAGELNAGAEPLGSIGLVVGATVGQAPADLAAVNGPLLAPGVGVQGATAADLRTVFGGALGNVLPTASRSILSAGPGVAALRDAAAHTLDDIRAALC